MSISSKVSGVKINVATKGDLLLELEVKEMTVGSTVLL